MREPQRHSIYSRRYVFGFPVGSPVLYHASQAESELSDTAKREELDAVINQARITVLKSLNLPTSTPSSDPKLQGLDPPFSVMLKAQSKQMLIDEELRRRK